MIPEATEKEYIQILCVDDNRNNLFTLETLLSGTKNCRILAAISGKKALEVLLAEEIDLILLDIRMPEMDGFEVAELLKSNKRTRDIPIIFITAVFKAEEFIQKGYEAGAVDYITKPIDDNQLLNKLNLYLKLFEKEKRLKKLNAVLEKNIDEKELLLREVHHRVKNNMQVIISLLKLQSIYTKDEKIIGFFQKSESRIKSMALVHEELYQMKNLADIDFRVYTQNLAHSTFHSFGIQANKVSLKIDIQNIFLGIDAGILCGLIINELLSNSLQHAFPAGETGEVTIALRKTGEGGFKKAGSKTEEPEMELVVSDNGIGFPKDMELKQPKTLGLHLVGILTKQLHGEMMLEVGNGVEFRVRFKEKKHAENPAREFT